MNTTAITSAEQNSSFEAKAQAAGTLDEHGFFTQSDYEFGLETLPEAGAQALMAHLSKGPVDHDSILFLKSFLMNKESVSFTPFD